MPETIRAEIIRRLEVQLATVTGPFQLTITGAPNAAALEYAVQLAVDHLSHEELIHLAKRAFLTILDRES